MPGTARGFAHPQGAARSPYLLEQTSETTDPERHFLEEGGKGLGSEQERPRLGAGQAPTGGTAPAGAHLPGSGTCRLPSLSTSSRGGRGCPAPASTARKLGVLEERGRGSEHGTGVHGPSSWWGCWERAGAGAGAPLGAWEPGLWLGLSQRWGYEVLKGWRLHRQVPNTGREGEGCGDGSPPPAVAHLLARCLGQGQVEVVVADAGPGSRVPVEHLQDGSVPGDAGCREAHGHPLAGADLGRQGLAAAAAGRVFTGCPGLTASLRPLGDVLGTAGLVLAMQAVCLPVADPRQGQQPQGLLAEEVVVLQVSLDWGQTGSSAPSWLGRTVPQPPPAEPGGGRGEQGRTQEPDPGQAGEAQHDHQHGDANTHAEPPHRAGFGSGAGTCNAELGGPALPAPLPAPRAPWALPPPPFSRSEAGSCKAEGKSSR